MTAQASTRTPRAAWQVQRSVWFALFLRELKTRFGGHWLGVYWALLEPLAHIVILLLIFGFMRHHVLPGVDYAVFLLVGLVPFFIFKNLTLRGMEAVDANRGLFGYRQVKPIDPLVARALLEVALYSAVYLIMLGAMAWVGFTVLPARPLELMGVSAVLLVFGFGLGLVFAVATDELPNARSFIRISFMPLYLLSGIMFPVSALPPQVLPWLLWNPILHAIELSRGYFFAQYHVVHGVSLPYVSAWALGTMALGLSLYRVRRHRLLAS
ncbi:MAG: ABC transporter permease [Caldimonas manganoxidans]|uniref:ABC transporter permease n=1 Tax=Caldimonas manganoxidans TaxID=196015 RepID=UPI0012EA9802|nr:ABC transporter permease [Caldimonas manganoxidans]MCX7659196.1 ABC transporter permease [Caldimonas manganoxidans]GIX24545.1 MAG: transport permease protein [Caldimonas sp.]